MDSRLVLDIFNDIAANSSRIRKEELLAEACKIDMVKEVLKWAYDPFIVFGVTPPKVVTLGTEGFDLSHKFIWAMMRALASRHLTGGEAHQTLLEWMQRLDEPSGELLWRMLSKDMRCGITAKTVNKVLPGTIPTFDVMLAHPYEEKRVGAWPVAVEPKLDGVRAICLVKNSTAQFFSRSGKSFPAVEHLGEAVVTMLGKALKGLNDSRVTDEKYKEYAEYFGDSSEGLQIALDGEIISGSFAETVSEVRRKGEAAAKAEYHVFDALPFNQFTMDGCNHIPLPYNQRRDFLRFMIGTYGQAGVKLIPSYLASSDEEIQEFYGKFRKRGLEGAIVKPLKGTYFKKRSHNWMKMKNQETEDLKVIDAFEGTGKYEGQLGGIICDRAGVEVRVGGGFTDQERIDLWSDYRSDKREYGGSEFKLLEKIAEVEFHEVTPDGSLRHPRFVRWRWDKEVEKAA